MILICIASWNLLLRVIEDVHPLILFLAYRPQSPEPEALQKIVANPSTVKIDVDRMSSVCFQNALLHCFVFQWLSFLHLKQHECEVTVCQALNVETLPESVKEIVDKAEGNPFHAEQLG